MDGAGDLSRDPVLELEQVRARPLVAIRPQLLARLGIDQLHGDAQTIATTTNGALDHIGDPELGSHFADIDETTLVGEGRLAGDDEEIANARQRRGDLLDDAIDEIVVLLAAQIVERHDDDGGLLPLARHRGGGVIFHGRDGCRWRHLGGCFDQRPRCRLRFDAEFALKRLATEEILPHGSIRLPAMLADPNHGAVRFLGGGLGSQQPLRQPLAGLHFRRAAVGLQLAA